MEVFPQKIGKTSTVRLQVHKLNNFKSHSYSYSKQITQQLTTLNIQKGTLVSNDIYLNLNQPTKNPLRPFSLTCFC